jgi:hypothetical protein
MGNNFFYNLSVKLSAIVLAFVASTAVHAYTVSVGTYVCNPDATISIPIMLDTVEGLANIGVQINYDSQVLICSKIEQGSLAEVFNDDFISSDDSAGCISIVSFAEKNISVDKCGSLAILTFMIRTGTEKQYSDVTIANITLGEETGVKDLSATSKLIPKNGMIRAFGVSDDCDQLEGAQMVVADTKLSSLKLSEGDSIQASANKTPIIVSGEVSTASEILVDEPEAGWTDGTYEVLTTPTRNLAFSVRGISEDESAKVSSVTENGVTTYSIIIDVEGEESNIVVRGATLSEELKDYAVNLAKAELSNGLTTVVVEGGADNVALAHDLGISPIMRTLGTDTVEMTFAKPTLKITAFDPTAGIVKAKVIPPAGMTIDGDLVVGVIRVIGSETLTSEQREISDIVVDSSVYKNADSKGEFSCTVQLGKNSFIRVKVVSE